MKRVLYICITCLIFYGCVTLQKVTVSEEPPAEPAEVKEISIEKIIKSTESSSGAQEAKEEEPKEKIQEKGIVFAKTDFQGLLEARYVKFLFEDLDDPNHKFQLHIGENSDEQTFPWEVKTVKPGYFFVELPAGRYKISTVSIPVGSTMATEKIDIRLEVFPNTICYVGTLKMVGTKEKIKLGGLPVIKPGFEYTVEVLDEQEEGAGAFRQNYPNYTSDVSINLMQVKALPPENI